MKVIDMHVHTAFSFDGRSTVEEECQTAFSNNLSGICFTEHFSVDPADVSYGVLDYESYKKKLLECKAKYGTSFWIGCGLEIGEPHLEKYRQHLNQMQKEMKLDFVIGSIHNIGSKKIRLFMDGKSRDEIYTAYFQEVLKMIEIADIDVIGHLDLAKRYAFAAWGDYDFSQYKDVLTQILICAIKRNIGIEVNTSGWRNQVRKTYPSVEVIKLYRELGGKYITLGSDAHETLNLGYCFSDARDMLLNAGFENIYYYIQRKPKEIALEKI